MAHFAEINGSNIVMRVVVVDNSNCIGGGGAVWCKQFFGGGTWVQTSYNATIRKNYAGIGFTYDVARDAFIAPRPFPSWSLDEATCQWVPLAPYPTDGALYIWDESVLSWVTL